MHESGSGPSRTSANVRFPAAFRGIADIGRLFPAAARPAGRLRKSAGGKKARHGRQANILRTFRRDPNANCGQHAIRSLIAICRKVAETLFTAGKRKAPQGAFFFFILPDEMRLADSANY
jgi:hypothetical protein